MKKLRLGIIGYGFMGQWHNNHAGTLEEVEIVAVCDTDPEKLAEAPKSAALYTDYRELLKNPDVEWVMVSVPNHLHHDIAIDAVKAKKNIIVEKPCALNVQEFDEMYQAARENGVIFTVDQNRRWDRDYSMVKKALEEKRLGNVFMVKSSHYGVFGRMHDWHEYPEFGGGMLYDWGVHLIDQMLDLIPGKITQISADMKCAVNEKVDDYFRILLYFENGLAAEIELGTFLLRKMPRWYVAGDTGTMVVESIKADEGAIYRAGEFREALPKTVKNLDAGPTRTFSVKAEDVVYTESLPVIERRHNDWNDFFRNLVGVINGQEELIVKPEQVRRVLGVMEAARESAKLRRSVDFE
ncbi:MAG: Gfo/Idh/MocA family oxidoreductase [Candidatus Limivivens sp.]|nr:Gfo/Idh/MocA family oxidoreductase [Candidatus Limivivens sp.]